MPGLPDLYLTNLLGQSSQEEQPYLEQLQKEIGNYERRIAAAGQPVPKPQKETNLLMKAIDIVDRPRNALVNAIQDVIDNENDFWQGFYEGLTGKEKSYSSELLEKAGIENPWLKVPLGFTLDVILDPLTYVGLPTTIVAKPGQILARKVGVEAGKSLTQHGVERFVRWTADVLPKVPGGQRISQFTTKVLDEVAPMFSTGYVRQGKIAYPEQEIPVRYAYEMISTMPRRGRGEAIARGAEIQRAFEDLRKGLGLTPERETEVAKQALHLIEYPTKLAAKGDVNELVNILARQYGPEAHGLIAQEQSKLLTEQFRRIVGQKKFNELANDFSALTAAAEEKLLKAKKRKPALPDLQAIYDKTYEKAVRNIARKADFFEEVASTAPPEVQEYARLAKQMGLKTAQEDIEAGITFGQIPNYIYHLYKDPPERIKEVLSQYRRQMVQRMRRLPKGGFQYERLIPTIEEAKELGLHPIEDVRLATMVREMEGVRLRTLYDMYKSLDRMGPEVIMTETQLAKAKQAARKVGDFDLEEHYNNWVLLDVPLIKNKYVHPEVARAVNNSLSVFRDEGAMREFLRIANGLQNLWKTWVTSPNPTFHLRNFLGNLFNSLVLGGVNPYWYIPAAAILSNPETQIRLGSTTVKGADLLDSFYKQALYGFGFFRGEGKQGTLEMAEDIMRGLQSPKKLFSREGVKGTYRKRLTDEKLTSRLKAAFTFPFSYGHEIGDFSETWSKLAHYLDRLARDWTPEKAAEDVRKFLFDYTDLTPMERTVFRSIFPFYTFTRKNIPLALESLYARPGSISSVVHLMDNARATFGGEEPQWLKDQLAIPGFVGPDGTQVYFNPDFPINQLAVFGPDILEFVWSQLTPLFRAPTEFVSMMKSGKAVTGETVMPYPGARGRYAVPTPSGPYELPRWVDWLVTQIGGPAREVMETVAAIPSEMPEVGGMGGVVRSIMDIATRSGAPPPEPLGKVPPTVRQYPVIGPFFYQVNPERERILEAIRRRRQLEDYRRYLTEVKGVELPTVRELENTNNWGGVLSWR